MTHAVHCVCNRVVEIVGKHDPHNLKDFVPARHNKQQHSRHRKKRRRKKQPRTRLSLSGSGAIDDRPHGNVGNGVQNLRNNWKDHKKESAPYRAQAQDIGIIHIEIGRHDGIKEKGSARSKQVPKPFLFSRHVLRLYLTVPESSRKRFPLHHFSPLSSIFP